MWKTAIVNAAIMEILKDVATAWYSDKLRIQIVMFPIVCFTLLTKENMSHIKMHTKSKSTFASLNNTPTVKNMGENIHTNAENMIHLFLVALIAFSKSGLVTFWFFTRSIKKSPAFKILNLLLKKAFNLIINFVKAESGIVSNAQVKKRYKNKKST